MTETDNQEVNQRLDRLKSEFVSMVSHELRTPMTIIKEAANLLLTKKVSSEKQKKYLQMINKHVDRLNRLISDLLDLSRIENNKMVFMREPVNLGHLSENIVAELMPLVQEKHLVFVPEVMPGLPVIVGDSQRINQVIVNLIGNAIKYTSRGGRINLKIFKENDTVIIKVSDTGRGLSPTQLNHVFEHFYVADESLTRSSGGTGLGLPIAKGIVEAMGGKIWGDSAGLGKGSFFAFSLPAENKGEDDLEEENIIGG